MKAFRICFFIFLFSIYINISKAENISDFQIGGFSLNESLLDKYTEKEIKKAKRKTGFKSKKYSKYIFFGKFDPYDMIVIYTKKKDKSYITVSIAGFISFDLNWEGCIEEQDSTSEEVQKLFPNSKKRVDEFVHQQDKTGESFERDVIFVLSSGEEIGSACQRWGKKYKAKYRSKDQLQVFLDTNEYAAWLRDGAYK